MKAWATPWRQVAARTTLALAVGSALLAGCSSAPPPPDWQMNAQGAAERGVEAWLSGVTAVAESEWARARLEVSRTGEPARLARLALLRCAAEVASLQFDDCPAYAALAADAAPPERAYARYLAGQAGPADAERLPPAHRALLGPATPAAAVQAVADPLSRLVAAGVLLRRGQADAALVAVAVDTASAQGWRRPLLAWLGLQHQRAVAAGDTAEAARLLRRIAVVEASAPAARTSRPAIGP